MTKVSELITKRAVELAKEDLKNEYGYMGRENAGHYVMAMLEQLDSLALKVSAIEQKNKRLEKKVADLMALLGAEQIEDHLKINKNE